MKNSEIAKHKFPFAVDVRDYLSDPMTMKSHHNKPSDSEKNPLSDKTVEDPEGSIPFDLFAHILEG